MLRVPRVSQGWLCEKKRFCTSVEEVAGNGTCVPSFCLCAPERSLACSPLAVLLPHPTWRGSAPGWGRAASSTESSDKGIAQTVSSGIGVPV